MAQAAQAAQPNCTTTKSCAGKGDTCAGVMTLVGAALNCNTSGSNCCAFGLYCLNGTCEIDNIGSSCKLNTDCFGAFTSSSAAVCNNGTCIYLYYAGDTCSTSNDCVLGLNCSSNVCQGVAAGQPCILPQGQCQFGTYCDSTSFTCKNTTATGQNCTVQSCVAGSSCVDGKCIADFTVANGADCVSDSCVTGSTCLLGKCVSVTTSFETCTNQSDCSNTSFCTCSPFMAENFCLDILYNPCTDEESDLVSCLASSSCTVANDAPNSCSYNNCYSDYKKTFSCGCSEEKDFYGNCLYISYCHGFPVWAIIVIIIVAIVLVLAVVLLVFFMMRRRRQYDSI